jgi:hypothetical protein
MYQVSSAINKLLKETVWPQIERTKVERKRSQYTPPGGSAADVATKALTQRRTQQGDKGASDKSEKWPVAEREKQPEAELVSEGVPVPQAKQMAVEHVRSNVKFLFQEADIPGTAMFDVRLKAGTIIILINSKHPAREHFFDLLKQEGAEVDSRCDRRCASWPAFPLPVLPEPGATLSRVRVRRRVQRPRDAGGNSR